MIREAALLACAACGVAPEVLKPDLVEAQRDFVDRHAQAYDVWETPLDRDAIYDVLAEVFVGEALTDQYVETWATRTQMEVDDVDVRILAVTHDDLKMLPPSEEGRVRLDASWTARGVVTHQGHRHARIHRYRGLFELTDTATGWRVEEVRPKELARVPSAIDDLFGDGGDPVEQGFMDPLELFDGGVLDGPAQDEGPRP